MVVNDITQGFQTELKASFVSRERFTALNFFRHLAFIKFQREIEILYKNYWPETDLSTINLKNIKIHTFHLFM